jgi:hypothetical protein
MFRHLPVSVFIVLSITAPGMAVHPTLRASNLTPLVDPDVEFELEQVLHRMGTHVSAVIDTRPAAAPCDVAMQFRQVQWLTIAAMGVVQAAQSEIHMYSLIGTRADRARAAQFLVEINGSYRRTLETDLKTLTALRGDRAAPPGLAVLNGQIQEDIRVAINLTQQPP